MATASTSRKTPAPTAGKLKGPSSKPKPVPLIKTDGKKSTKPKQGAQKSVTETTMAASEHVSAAAAPLSQKLNETITLDSDDESSPPPSDSVTNESLGSLVCISGAQVGTLRYFGETHFESGYWCGVECNEAVGKNDGSVLGVRYFQCKDKFGIFAPLSKVRLMEPSNPPSKQQHNSGKMPKDYSASQQKPPSETPSETKSRPKTLATSSVINNKPARGEDEAPVAPTTTPVSVEEKNPATSISGIKRLKKESKRVKDSPHRVNQQQKKKRKLDSGQKPSWSGPCSTTQSDRSTPTSQPSSESVGMSSQNADLPNLLTVRLKEEILGASFQESPLYSPPASYRDSFNRLPSSTPGEPTGREHRGPTSRLERLRFEKYKNYTGTPTRTPRDVENKRRPGFVEFGEIDKDGEHESPLSNTSPVNELESHSVQEPIELSKPVEEGAEGGESEVLSPTGSDIINLDNFPAKRPSSISLFPGFSSEESSELGIFGVSTPELIGGDSVSLALSIPTSCCSSPEALGLDNESSLGLLTPSHLQDWNSNTNDEDLYLHLRSPSVDDVDEFEEEDKTVDQDLLDQAGSKPDNFRLMSSSLNGSYVLNQNDGLIAVQHPMHQSLHEELHLSQGRVRRDRTYTQLPGITNLNHNQQLKSQTQLQDQLQTNSHPPLSFRVSGSGSGSGYCASEPFTDSDFNTESEADHDHDECSSSTTTAGSVSKSSHVSNPTSMKNRSARVIDGALYTSHHHQHNQHQKHSEGRDSPPSLPHHPHNSTQHFRQDNPVGSCGDNVGKNSEMISSSISVSVSSNSASACASEMESSGFYSDASERNPSGGSVMSESDGCNPHRSTRHLSKSSSECDDSSVAVSLGMKMVPLKPLALDPEILSASSVYDDNDISIFEKSLDLDDTTGTLTSLKQGASPKKVAILKTNPPVVGFQKEFASNDKSKSVDQQVPRSPSLASLQKESGQEEMDLCEDMEVDLFTGYEEQSDIGTGFKNGDIGDQLTDSGPSSYVLEISHDDRNHFSLSIINASHDNGESMDFDLEESFCYRDSKSAGASPATSPMKTGIPVMGMYNSSALHGNNFDTGIVGDGETDSSCSLGHTGGGGCGSTGAGSACIRSQSVNCIASLTSSTSSASTVTTRSCVTTGGPSSRSNIATHPGGNVIATNLKLPSSDPIPTLCAVGKNERPLKINAKSGQGKVKNGGESNARMLDDNEQGKGSGSNNGKSNVKSTTAPSSASTTKNAGKATNSSTSSKGAAAAEQSSDVSTTTTNGNNGSTSRRPSRPSTTNGKGTTARKVAAPGCSLQAGGVGKLLNSSNCSTISSSTDLNRTSRSLKSNSTLHGSNRSLASVGLAPSPANKLSSSHLNTSSVSIASSVAAKKNNKWDAVMSKIAETKHKPINVKNVKSRVFTSGKSGGEGSNASSATTTSSSNGGKTLKPLKSSSRVTVPERTKENDPLVPPAIHRRQQQFSSRSSTVSDSSLDDQPHRGPPPVKHRVKKDVPINRRQVSDLSSTSEYSGTTQSQRGRDPPTTTASASLSGKTMTTGGARRAPRASNGSSSGAPTGSKTVGTKGSASTSNAASGSSNSSAKSQGTKGAQTTGVESARKKVATSSLGAPARAGTVKSNKVGAATVSSQNDPSTKSHPAVKPLRDRNRLSPVGKSYGSPGLDANANVSDSSLLLEHEQANGDLDKSSTNGPTAVDGGVAEPKNKATTKKPANARVSAANQQNLQNSLLIQENSSLKEELSRLTTVVSDLQQQIGQLTSSGEETRKTLEDRLSHADLSCAALAIVSQQSDKERIRVYEKLAEQETQAKDWKLKLDEKLVELRKLQQEYEEEQEIHQDELRTLSSNHEIEVDVTVRNCENKLAQMQKRYDETLAELKRSHTEELERLQESQRTELEQTVQKHRELLDQHRNQSPHDILLKEVESLEVVMEMRNEEIRVLRKDLMDYKNTLNDLQMAREHGKSLLAKIEDLEAQLEKARSDKRSLQERYQSLEAALQQLESDNNRLARSNEELNWKMKSYEIVEN